MLNALLASALLISSQQEVGPALRIQFAPQNPSYAGLSLPNFVERFYPDLAREKDMEGRAVVECQVGEGGRPATCVVIEETPAGVGFGPQTLRMMDQFVVIDAQGQPAKPGQRVRQAFNFSL